MSSDPTNLESDDAEDVSQETEFEPVESLSGESEAEPVEDVPAETVEEASDEVERPEEPVEKPRRKFRLPAAQWDVYTVMLGISLLAVSIACLLLLLELQQYSPFPWWRTSGILEGS
jgi:hypothetical protein